jgi:dGTPase
MIRNSKKIIEIENKNLAGYAVKSSQSRGRVYPEKESKFRTPFQRDRDRIIHCKAFRRLKHKTQVFIISEDDHYRDRLTHTLEVAQISRDVARIFGLNEDLAESIALAHDLGHTPFGHSGEEVLNEIMHKFSSGFEHNLQSKRVVTLLEKRYPDFDGLNLSIEVIEGLMKHQTAFDNADKKLEGNTLEAQIVNLADEIAYTSHDIDDGLRSKLFSFKEISKLKLIEDAVKKIEKSNYDTQEIFNSRVVSQLISLMIDDLLNNTEKNILKLKIKTLQDVMKAQKIADFSTKMNEKIKEARNFLLKRMYYHPKQVRKAKKGQMIIQKLFDIFYKNPELLPEKFQKIIKEREPLEIVVKDYIAGMTDSYAMNEYNRFFPLKKIFFS